MAAVAAGFLLSDKGGDLGGAGGTTTTTPTTTTTTAIPTTAGTGASGAEVPDFDGDYDGTPDEGQELIDWLLDHEGCAVHLDLSFTGPPAETDSPPFWSNCAGVAPGEQ